jgi:DNA repair protein RadC
MTVKIKDMCYLDRPRERLIKYGTSTLSDSELLSILIGSGNNKNSAKDLANIILNKCGGIKGLSKYNYSSLTNIPGIKMSKACIILATIEISRRCNTKINDINNIKLNNSKLVFEYYNDRLKNKKQEYFYCIYLDNNKKVINDKLLFKGTLNYSLIHPREVFKEAYILSASAIICVHNHPSGNINPSIQDIESTANLVEIGKMHGIKVLDHIIIGNNNYYSFLENNRISL